MAFKGPQPPFGAILTHFWLALVESPSAVFGSFWTHKTAKGTQHGINLDQKRFSTVPSAAGKCWPSAFLVTNMRFASLYHRGGLAAFQCRTSAIVCLCGIGVSHSSALVYGIVHSLDIVCQTVRFYIEYAFTIRLSSIYQFFWGYDQLD